MTRALRLSKHRRPSSEQHMVFDSSGERDGKTMSRQHLPYRDLRAPACAGGGQKPSQRTVAQINRALTNAPGAAQPSTIVAAELAFSRAARERGQWTAFRMFAAPGALLHGKNGPFPIEPWLATQIDPPAAVQWEPRAVAIELRWGAGGQSGTLPRPGRQGRQLRHRVGTAGRRRIPLCLRRWR